MNSIAPELGSAPANGAAAALGLSQPAIAAPAGRTIFVQLAAYRDSECVPTILNLFQKAARPDDISVGVCWQFLPGLDPANLDLHSFQNRVRVLSVDARTSRGVCWARHLAEQFYDGEDYFLQVDSHTRFVPNWDDLMREELARCDSTKAVLTCNPPRYYPPDRLEPNPRPMVKRASPFMAGGDIRCQAEYLDVFPDAPVQCAFVSGGLVFAKGDLLRQVATDPWMYTNQDEITYAMRLFTHGWNVYCPSQVLVYHHYYDATATTATRPLHWQDCKEWSECHRIANARFNHLSEFALSADPCVLVDLDKYSLGVVRSLEEYQAFCGVDFRNKTVTDRGLQLRFIPGIERLRKNPIPIQKPASPESTRSKTGPAPSSSGQGRPQPLAAEFTNGFSFTTAPWKLEVGDFVPFFTLPARDGRIREIQHYAGKPIVLYFLSDPAHPGAASIGSAIAALYSELSDSTHHICILPAGADRFEHVLAPLPEKCTAWKDAEGKIHKLFGFAVDEEPSHLGGWALLTPNLRVAAIAPFDRLENDMNVIRSKLESLKSSSRNTIKRNHAPVLLVDDVLSKAQCDWLIDHWKAGDRFDGKVGAGGAYDPTSKIRVDCVLRPESRTEVDQQLARRLLPEINKVFNLKVTRREPYKIGWYSAEKGSHFRPHRDNFDPPLFYRRLALTINLNDGFEGGGVMFPEYGHDEYAPGPGCALVFPCTLVHGVSRVTAGERFMVVSFLYSEKEHELSEEWHRCHGTTRGFDDRLLVEW